MDNVYRTGIVTVNPIIPPWQFRIYTNVVKPQAMKLLLEEMRIKAGLTREELADRVGVTATTIFRKERGKGKSKRDISAEEAALYANALGCSVNDLYGEDDGNMQINAYDVRLSAGAGTFIVEENLLHKLAFRREWIRDIKGGTEEMLAVAYVEGRSMEPTLYDGDPVLIDRSQTTFTKEGIYALRYDDEALIKRLVWEPETSTLRIISDNPTFTEKRVKRLELVTVIGKALWTGRKL